MGVCTIRNSIVRCIPDSWRALTAMRRVYKPPLATAVNRRATYAKPGEPGWNCPAMMSPSLRLATRQNCANTRHKSVL